MSNKPQPNYREQIEQLQKAVVDLEKKLENTSTSKPASIGPDFSGQELFKFYVQATIQSALSDVRLKTLAEPTNQRIFIKQIIEVATSLTNETLDVLE